MQGLLIKTLPKERTDKVIYRVEVKWSKIKLHNWAINRKLTNLSYFHKPDIISCL